MRGGYTPWFEWIKKQAKRVLPERAFPPSGPNPERDIAFRRPLVRKIWIALALLDLIRVCSLIIRWRLARGEVVIADRYIWDTLIDFRLNHPNIKTERSLLWRILLRLAPVPHASFVIFVPVEESIRRSKRKNEPFPDPPETLAARLEQYESLAFRGGWHRLDGLNPIDRNSAEIRYIVNDVMLGRRPSAD